MKIKLYLAFMFCLINASLFGMQRVAKPVVVARTFASCLVVRSCASKNNPEKEDIFNHVKEGLGTKSDFLCCAYLAGLGYVFYCWMLPKSAYRYDRHPRFK